MKRVVCIAISMLVTATVALAHHSFAAEFDATKPITLKGTITKVEWTNPHTYFHVDATDENGKRGEWAVEGGAPNVLYRQGWKPDTLKVLNRSSDLSRSRTPNIMALAPMPSPRVSATVAAKPGARRRPRAA